MDDVLKLNQAAHAARQAGKVPEARKLDAVDRREATNSADAKKARQIVRDLRCNSLPVLCATFVKYMSDLKVKHGLQEAFERFAVANQRYMREELKDENTLIGWPVGNSNGRMAPLPPGSPEHKVELVAAWNLMLGAVNEVTKVGVYKPHRELPIMLVVDLEVPENALIVPTAAEWN